MTIEKAQELCENSEYNSEAKNVIRRGLEIMEKYCDDVDVQGEHDVIYAAPFSEDMSEEDVRVLADLNWHVDTDCDRWAHF